MKNVKLTVNPENSFAHEQLPPSVDSMDVNRIMNISLFKHRHKCLQVRAINSFYIKLTAFPSLFDKAPTTTLSLLDFFMIYKKQGCLNKF